MEKQFPHRVNAVVINALYWCHMMPNRVRKRRNDPSLTPWPRFVPDGEKFQIVDWMEVPEVLELAGPQTAFEFCAPENLIFHVLKLGSFEDGTGHELYQKLDLRGDTLFEHLARHPKVADLPTKILCDALLSHLSYFNPYKNGLGLAYSAREHDRFDFSPPIVNFPFDPGPLTFLFEDLSEVGLCHKTLGGYKWSDDSIASLQRLGLWPYDHDHSDFQCIWDELPPDIRTAILSGYVMREDLDDLIITTSHSLKDRQPEQFSQPFKRIAGMSRHQLANTMIDLVRAGLVKS